MGRLAAPSVSSSVPTLAEVVAALEARYDPRWAEDWDAVGLVCGDPDAAGRAGAVRRRPGRRPSSTRPSRVGRRPARHPPPAAAARRCTASPRPTPKGRLVHRARRAGGRALLRRAHQRRRRRPGRLRRAGRRARARPTCGRCSRRRPTPLDKLVTFVPAADAERVVDALAAAGAGRDRRLRPVRVPLDGAARSARWPGANPAIGAGRRASSRSPRRGSRWCCRAHRARGRRRGAARGAPVRGAGLRRARAGAARRSSRGLGRVGDLAEPRDRSREFAERVAGGAAGHGAAACGSAGDPDRPVAHGRGLRRSGRRAARRRRAPPASTCTSPPTCATTRRPRPSRHGGPRAGRRRALGHASGRGCADAPRLLVGDLGRARRTTVDDAGLDDRHRPVDASSAGPARTRPSKEPTLNAEPADQLRLLDVQALDTRSTSWRTGAHAARARRARPSSRRAARRCATRSSPPRPRRATSRAS